MKTIVTWLFWSARSAYYLRKRSWVMDELTGKPRHADTKEKISDEWFERAGVDPRSKSVRGDVVAAKYAAKREEELAVEPQVRRMSVRAIGNLWLERHKNQLDPKTIVRNKNIIAHLAEFFGDDNPSALHVGRWEQYRDKRLEDYWIPRLGKKGVRKISPRTVWNEVTFGVSLLAWAYERRRETGMTELPVMKPPHVGDHDRVAGRKLSIEEFWLAYEAAAKRPQVGARMQMMLVAGLTLWLRKSPLTNLDKSWIDRVGLTVTVPPAYVKKGRARKRRELVIPMTHWFASILEPGLDNVHTCVWGINRRSGRPASNLFHTLRAIANDAKIRPFSLHDLRRTGNTIVRNHRCEKHGAGWLNKDVSDRILAHSMPMNDEAYLEIDVETMREALSVFDELWQEYRKGIDDSNVLPFSATR
jgi:integrase